MSGNSAYVIVGASLAGAKAAEALRAEGFDGPVILIGEESDSVQRHTAQLIAEAVIGVTAVRFADPAIAG